jgi:urease accessory protein
MRHDTERMRGARPYQMTKLKTGDGVDRVIEFIVARGLLRQAGGPSPQLG